MMDVIEEDSTTLITGPKAFSVYQRQGVGKSAGNLKVIIKGHEKSHFPYRLTYQVRQLGERPFPVVAKGDLDLAGTTGKELLEIKDIPSGGWYTLLAMLTNASGLLGKESFGPIGIGERFLIAGQSYAGNHNDVLLSIDDLESRAVAYDGDTSAWRVAHDPQPAWPAGQPSHWLQISQEILRRGTIFAGGSIWPAMANRLVPNLNVPIGLLSVTRSGTRLEKWLPGTELFEALVAAVKTFHPFRAVLWQLGETDAFMNTNPNLYIEQFKTLKAALEAETGVAAPWLIGKSTFHPAIGVNQQGVVNIRAATDTIVGTVPDTFPGAEIDLLGQEFRQVDRGSRHFTAEGQKQAGLLWADAIATFLSRHDVRSRAK